MTATISITQDQMVDDLISFLTQTVTVTDCRISQQNRIPMPTGNYIIMTPMGPIGLSTNRIDYQADPTTLSGSQLTSRTTEWRCQLDFYGDAAQENANIIATMTRSEYACEIFRAGTSGIVPFYCTDPFQNTMVNGEDQFENRYTCEFHAQINPIITTSMEFFNSVNIVTKEVDATFPPENS